MLRDLAKHYIKQDISNYCFVFPNRRAGLFFKKYLNQYATKTIILPEVLTIADLYQKYSKLKVADKLTLLFELYKTYSKIMCENSKLPETFDTFVSFGETLLADFNDIDTYIIDAKKLFVNIDDLNKLSNTEYLTQDQIDILNKLFNSEITQTGKLKENFKSIWSLMYPIYKEFRESLLKKGIAYAGMQQRAVIEENKVNGLDTEYKKVIFVGFNALNEAERQLFKSFGDKADFYWDYDLPFVNDNKNLAHRFSNDNKSKFQTKEKIELTPVPEHTDYYNIMVPSMTAQATETKRILNELNANNINTVIVLLDEQMLLPMLLALPVDDKKENKSKFNVTMGFPISHTPILDFIEQFILLQKTAGNNDFYHKHTLALLSHPYIQSLDAEKISKLSSDIIQNNKIRITTDDIKKSGIENPIFSQLFRRYTENTILEQSITIASMIKPANEYDEECLAQVLLALNNLNKLIKEYKLELTPLTLLKTIKQSISNICVSFKGEPLNGLQIMGTLETRCLSFENVIFLSFNEGVFPKSSHNNSIIPYSLRVATGLPTTEHQDAVYAYNFYRLIARAKNVYMISDSRTDNMKSGEPSRYLKQLKYIYNKEVIDVDVTSNISIPKVSDTITKPDDFAEKLTNGKIKLSASAIETYLTCPVKFYIQKYLNIDEDKEITEILESNKIGSIFHKAAETLYKEIQDNQRGNNITAEVLEDAKKNTLLLKKHTINAFKTEYFKIPNDKLDSTNVELSGINKLMENIIISYLKQVLTEDMKKTPFKLVECERLCEEDYVIKNSIESANKKVRLKGFIDRIDSYTNSEGKKVLRVIDYKTGSVKINAQPDIKSLKKSENAPLCQLLMYEYFLKNANKNKIEFDEIELHIYCLQSLNQDNYQTKQDSKELYNIYLETLDSVISDILAPDQPLTRTTNKRYCKYCKQIAAICRRLN